jgi:hypothetical protein
MTPAAAIRATSIAAVLVNLIARPPGQILSFFDPKG